jgi:hypothetical protein
MKGSFIVKGFDKRVFQLAHVQQRFVYIEKNDLGLASSAGLKHR